MTAAPQSVQRICERLRAMPSSLNDACRTMEEAADEIERLRGIAQTAKETCVDCGKIDPCDDACPNFVEPTQGGDKGEAVAFVPLTEDGRPQWAETFGADDGCYIDYPSKWKPLYFAAPQPTTAGGSLDRNELMALLQDLASVNLSCEAAERQARRMADDLIARGLGGIAYASASRADRLWEERNRLQNSYGHGAFGDGLVSRRIAEIDKELSSLPSTHRSPPAFKATQNSAESDPVVRPDFAGGEACRYCNGTKRALYFTEQGWAQEWRDCHACSVTSTDQGGAAK